MVNEFCGFTKGVIGKDLPADSTLNNMKKEELIKLLHTAQHNYETLMWFYHNAVKANEKWLGEEEERLRKRLNELSDAAVRVNQKIDPVIFRDAVQELKKQIDKKALYGRRAVEEGQA